jgi:hypothetical protein
MFPSLCFIEPTSASFDSDNTKLLEDNLSDESLAIVTETSQPYINFKFKIIELFSNNNLFSAKK